MPADTDDSDTTSALTRWNYTNDILAFVLVLSFVAVVAVPLSPFVLSHEGLNPALLTAFITGFGIAVTWAFGPDALQAWQDTRGGK